MKPSVKVPVLSNAIVWMLFNSSMNLPPLIKIPFFAPLVNAEIIEIGVDKARAQGQEITRKVMDKLKNKLGQK